MNKEEIDYAMKDFRREMTELLGSDLDPEFEASYYYFLTQQYEDIEDEDT